LSAQSVAQFLHPFVGQGSEGIPVWEVEAEDEGGGGAAAGRRAVVVLPEVGEPIQAGYVPNQAE